MDKTIVYTLDRGDPGASRGCLGSLVMGFVFLLGVVLFIGAVVLVVGFFFVAVLVALVALGINRFLIAVSPRFRERQATQGAFRPTARVIETTARVIDSTKPKRRN
jgi:hypothetical protein